MNFYSIKNVVHVLAKRNLSYRRVFVDIMYMGKIG